MTNDAPQPADRSPHLDAQGIADFRKAKRRSATASIQRTGAVTGISSHLSLIAEGSRNLPQRPLRVSPAPKAPPATAPDRPRLGSPAHVPSSAVGRRAAPPPPPPPPPQPRARRASATAVHAAVAPTPALSTDALVTRLAELGDRCAAIGPISWGCAGAVGSGVFLGVASLLPGATGALAGIPGGGLAGAATLFAVSLGGGTLRPLLLLLPGARPGVVHTPPARLLFDAPMLALAGAAAAADGLLVARRRLGLALNALRRPVLAVTWIPPLLPALALALAVVGVVTALRSQHVAADSAAPERSAGSAIHASAVKVLLKTPDR